MRGYFCLILVIISLSQVGCVDPFVPEVTAFENNLVVEGQILEGKQPAVVRLSRSFGLNEEQPERLRNARVGIRDDAGGEIFLTEIVPGVYQSDTSEYEGIPGRSYQLFFELAGESYESSWMLMKPGTEIKDVYWELEKQGTGNDSTTGAQFYLNTSDPENKTIFYRWEFTETWEFRVPEPAIGLWNWQANRPDFYNPDSIPETCWRMDTSSRIIIATTEGLNEDKIVDLPLHYVSTEDNQLRIKYSILIKQYSISKETYQFYQQLKSTTEDIGGLFDPIPSEVIGNIRNTGNPDETVLGYFSADGYDSRRIFIDKSDLPGVFVPDGFEACRQDTLFTASEMEIFLDQGGAYVRNLYNLDGSFYAYFGARIGCSDCRLSGSFVEPDFWE